jgi:outer membrane protein assembly factor BamD (BamD/ComL family)
MRIQHLYIALIALGSLASCNGNNSDEATEKLPNKDSLLTVVKDLDSKILNYDGVIAKEQLVEAVKEFQNFAFLFPDDPQAPDFLMKAADCANAADQNAKSVKILNKIIERYPNYAKLESVKFTRATQLDFELRDTTLAKEAYQEFIQTYPNSEMVGDAQSRIENIALSEEELIQKFLQDLEAEKVQ